MVMDVYYKGWGYWEYNDDDVTNRPIGASHVQEESSLFELPKQAEREVTHLGETLTGHLLESKRSEIKGGPNGLNEKCYFVLCDKPVNTHPDLAPQINNITKKYTTTDIVPNIIDLGADTPKDLTETERNTLLKLILGMAIDTYGYVPGGTKNKATGSNNGSIKASLEKVGLGADEKTISKYLQEATERYPDAKPPKP